MKMVMKRLAAALALLLVSTAGSAQDQKDITLKVTAPEEGEQFACRIPVTVSHGEGLELRKLSLVAKVYQDDVELSSTGLETNGRPLVRDHENGRVEYAPTPVQFDLVEEDCKRIDGLGIVFAACTFSDGAQEDCLDRLRLTPEKAGQVVFFVGEP